MNPKQPKTLQTVNLQDYSQSRLSGSSSEQDALEDAERLYNAQPPNLAILHEKPEHRLAIFLKAQGLSNDAIAKKLGYSPPWVSQILRQPWARIRLMEEIRATGIEPVQALLAASAEDSVYTLLELRDNTKVENTVRRACADSLLDRFLGKAIARVEADVAHRAVSGDIDAVNRELEELKREEARLIGASN